jgi:hypothetical protein
VTDSNAQEQFQSECEQDSIPQQQQSIKPDSHSTTEEVIEQSEVDQNYAQTVPETEIEHQISSQNINNNGPKTYANLVKSFPNVGSTSPQVPKPSISPVHI